MKARAKLPVHLQVEPSGRCNLSCRMCAGGLRRDGKQKLMHIELLDTLLDQLPDAQDVRLQGLGEPLMHPEFVQFVERASSRGLTTSTSTNLVLLDKKVAEGVIAAGLDDLTVSIDGASEATYGWFRRDASLLKVIDNMAMLIDRRKEAGSETPRLTVTSVIMKENIGELPGIVRLAGAIGATSFSAQHLSHRMDESALPRIYRPVRDFVRSQTLSEDELPGITESFSNARKEADRYGIDISLPQPLPQAGAGKPACDWPWKAAYISHIGLMLPCGNVGTPDRCNMGDVNENGFEAVWNGPRFMEFREKLLQGETPEVCASCSVIGGCVTQSSRAPVFAEQFQRV